MYEFVLPVAALVALTVAVPAQAEVVASSPDGFVSRNTVEVTASPMEVWAQFIAPAGWWNGEHTYSGDAANLYIDAQATGCFCEKLPVPAGAPATQRMGSVEHLHIVYSEPGRVMRLQGGLGPLQSEAVNGTLTMTLRTQDGKTRILLEYVVGGYMRQEVATIAPLVDRVIAEQLTRLAAKFPVRPPAPASAVAPVRPPVTAPPAGRATPASPARPVAAPPPATRPVAPPVPPAPAPRKP
jgi:hypothetical protein